MADQIRLFPALDGNLKISELFPLGITIDLDRESTFRPAGPSMTCMKMRYLAAILLAVSCISCQHLRKSVDDDQLLRREVSEFEGKEYCFDIAKSILDRAPPKWEAKAPFPPLSPREADAVALKEAERIRADVRHWNRDSILLVPLNELADNGHWYYLVRLWRGDIGYAGLPPCLEIPVLMNGRIAER